MVFPHDPIDTPAMVERLKSDGFLILGTAPLSGMILAATAPAPGIEPILCEYVRAWEGVKAVEQNIAGEELGRQPTVCPPTNSYTRDQCDLPFPSGHVQVDCTPVSGQPNDPTWCYQWGLLNIGQRVVDLEWYSQSGGDPTCWVQFGRAGVDINVLPAWERTTGSPLVTVAILDSGIETCNPDFDEERFHPDPLLLTCAGNDGDAYPCYDTDPPNFGSDRDNNGHGTLVASVIAAVVDNDLGMTGIDQQCKILNGRVFGTHASSHMAPNTARAIIALESISAMEEYESVRVINISFAIPYVPPGPGGPNEQMSAFEYACTTLFWQNRFVVVGSGNGGEIATADDFVPQRFASVITVGGIDSRGWRFDHPGADHASSVGNCLDFVAPGMAEVLLVCQTPGCTPTSPPSPPCLYTQYECYAGKHNFLSGTSYAAPKVCGAISLILARAIELGILCPDDWTGLTWADVYDILKHGARDQVSWGCGTPNCEDEDDEEGWDTHFGWGLIDIDASLEYLETNYPPVSPPCP